MRCLISLVLGLLALEAVLALDPAFTSAQSMCPESSSSSEDMLCTQDCFTDQDCAGEAMCCPSACGLSCRTPIRVSAPKSGRRPWPVPLLPELCKQQSQCSGDFQCPGNTKCRLDGCTMKCQDPVPEVPLQEHLPQTP